MNFVSNAQLVPNICHSIHCYRKGIQESLFIFLVIDDMLIKQNDIFFVSIATLCLIYILYNDLPPI